MFLKLGAGAFPVENDDSGAHAGVRRAAIEQAILDLVCMRPPHPRPAALRTARRSRTAGARRRLSQPIAPPCSRRARRWRALQPVRWCARRDCGRAATARSRSRLARRRGCWCRGGAGGGGAEAVAREELRCMRRGRGAMARSG